MTVLYASAKKSFELSPAISYGPSEGKTSKGALKFPVTNQQAVQCDEIAKVLLACKQLPSHISGEEGWKDACVMDAIYEAARTGRRFFLAEGRAIAMGLDVQLLPYCKIS